MRSSKYLLCGWKGGDRERQRARGIRHNMSRGSCCCGGGRGKTKKQTVKNERKKKARRYCGRGASHPATQPPTTSNSNHHSRVLFLVCFHSVAIHAHQKRVVWIGTETFDQDLVNFLRHSKVDEVPDHHHHAGEAKGKQAANSQPASAKMSIDGETSSGARITTGNDHHDHHHHISPPPPPPPSMQKRRRRRRR